MNISYEIFKLSNLLWGVLDLYLTFPWKKNGSFGRKRDDGWGNVWVETLGYIRPFYDSFDFLDLWHGREEKYSSVRKYIPRCIRHIDVYMQVYLSMHQHNNQWD